MLETAFKTRTRDEWAELFAPRDACVAPVLTLDEAPQHPHNTARGSFVNVGGADVAAPAPRFSRTPAETGELTVVGAETGRLLEQAGYTAEEIAQLRADGAIA